MPPRPEPARRADVLARTRQGRLIAIVVATTAALWVVAQALIPQLGISPRYAILIDLIALAAFIWSLLAAWRIWRTQRRDE